MIIKTHSEARRALEMSQELHLLPKGAKVLTKNEVFHWLMHSALLDDRSTDQVVISEIDKLFGEEPRGE